MFRNDQLNGAKKRRTGSTKKLAVLLTSLALLIIIAVGGTLAYLFTNTEPVTNTFTPAKVDVTIEEDFDRTTDPTVKKDVKFQNTSNIPVYLRAMLVINWVDAEGNIVADVPDSYSYTMSGLPMNDDEGNSNWTAADADGYYYYKLPVAADAETDILLNECKAVSPENPEYFLQVDVLTEVIQAEPADAVKELWKSVNVDVNGNLMLDTSTAN